MQSSLSCFLISIKPYILRMARWLHVFVDNLITSLNWVDSFIDAASWASCWLLMSSLVWAHFPILVSSRAISKEAIVGICLSLNFRARCHHYWIIYWVNVMVSAWTVIIVSIVVRSHMRKYFWESLSVSGYSFCWVSERQFFPGVIVCLLTVHVHQIFLAWCTRLWPDLSFAEHRLLFIWSSLSWKQIHYFSYFFTKKSKSFHHIVFICKLIENLLDHISKFV